MALTSAQFAVNTTPVLLATGISVGNHVTRVTLSQLSGAVFVFLGASTVTPTTGALLVQGMTVQLLNGDTLWGVKINDADVLAPVIVSVLVDG